MQQAPKRPIACAAAAIALVGIAAAAATGFPSETLRTRPSTPWTTSITASEPGDTVYPGGPMTRIKFTITNGQNGETLRRVTPSISIDQATGDAKTRTGTVIPGCLARWFNVVPDPGDPPLPTSSANASAIYRGSVDLTMSDAPVSQDACQGRAPAVTVEAIP
jgi:hypothetical protein